MRLLRTSLLLERAEQHVGKISRDPEVSLIANYLAQAAAVTFYSEVEERVREIIAQRLSACGDPRVANFIATTHDKMLSRISKSDISATVKLFGEECRERFNAEISEREVSKYSNVINSRHQVSHGVGASVTIAEVGEAARIAEKMLACVERAIV